MSEHKTQKRKWVPQTSNVSGSVDYAVFEKINSILKEESSSEVTDFFAKGFGNQAIQGWSFFAQVNDHKKFTSSTITLTKFLTFINADYKLHEHGIQLIKEILTNYTKTIYRGLSNLRASLTNPIIRLLNEIVLFKNGALIDDFVALFDFTLPVLPKLLVPSKTELSEIESTKEKEFLSIRYCMIRFLLNLLKYSAPFLRKNLLANNHKLLINWFKYISVIDSNTLIVLTLEIWDEKIVKEQSFKKATKIKVFNDWNITKLLPIYYTKDKDLRTVFDKFIISLATDSKYGLKFSDEEKWFSNSANSGSISVHGKSFKTHNKLLYSLITNLKPWDDDLQLNTTIQILSASPELIPPFVNYLASRGLHDPKLSSFWLGQTLLLSKLISFEIPFDVRREENITSPSTNIAFELIVPSVLNRSVLARCLLSDSLLIRQLSAQLIVSSLQKLEKFITLYTSKGWNEEKAQLISKTRLCLPELITVVNAITDSYSKKSDNKILLLTLLTVVNGYIRRFPENSNISQQISKPYSDVINVKEFSSIDFVLLDNFFQLQEGDNSQIRWWNKSDKSKSLFTSLLKLASSGNSSTASVSSKISSLLSNFVKQTDIFNKESTKADQIHLLVLSLQLALAEEDAEGEEAEKIWKLLDESISRCVRSPFKYFDTSNDLERISPLIITVFEQWKFVDKSSSYELASKWLLVWLRYLIIAGEPVNAILGLTEKTELAVDANDYLPLGSDYSFSKENPLADQIDASFFHQLTSGPLNKLQSISKIPSSNIDVVGALFRLSKIFEDDKLVLSERNLEKIIVEILSKVGNYLFGNTSAIEEISNSKYWGNFFNSDYSNEKSAFISSTLAEIFSQLPNFKTDEFKNLINKLIQNGGDHEAVISASLWSMDQQEIIDLLSIDDNALLVKTEGLSILLERGSVIKSSLLSKLLKFESLFPQIEKFINNGLVSFDNVDFLLNTASKKASTLKIFRSLANEKSIASELFEFMDKRNDPTLTSYVIASFSSSTLSEVSENAAFTGLANSAKIFALDNIEKEQFDEISFVQQLHILLNPALELTEEQKSSVLSYALTKHNNKYTTEICKAVEAFGSFEDVLVKTWLNKAILFMTKVLAEFSELSSSFREFLDSFKSLTLKSKLIQIANKPNLNALLEVILTKWPVDENALVLVGTIVAVASKSSLETNKLLQMAAFNEDGALVQKSSTRSKYLSALIIWRLFEFDVSKNATAALQERLLSFYNGSQSAHDLLLYRTLERIETRLNSSWIDSVFTWEFLDSLSEEDYELIGETKLIEKKKEGYIVSLNKTQITNTTANYNIKRHELPSLNSSGVANWDKLESFYEAVRSSEYLQTYDPLFLSLLILNNEELITISTEESEHQTPKVNMRKLVDSELFSFILVNLASENVILVNVTLDILSTILVSLKTHSTFKDKHIFELFLSKIIFTFKKTSEDGEKVNPQDFEPLVFALISKISDILVNPGHFLYEKAFRWVLKSPTLRQNDIPLFNDITVISATNDESSNYYKQLLWLIQGIVAGIKSKKDTKLLRSKNVYEWILNLESSPYITPQLRFTILEFIKNVQSIEDGADILITRYGGLSSLEQHIGESEVSKSLTSAAQASTISEQELLNLKELGVRYSVVGQSKKRIVDWTQDDLSGFSKRLHTTTN